MEWIIGLLPLLLFAACPVMMAFCFFGMRKKGCSTESAPAINSVTASVQGLAPAEQIAALQAHLSRLEAEQSTIARQITELASAPPEPESSPAVQRMEDVPVATPSIATSRA